MRTRKPCRWCGGPKPKGCHSAYCSEECRELGAARVLARHRDRHRRPCRGCGGPKEAGLKVAYCAKCRLKLRICKRCGRLPIEKKHAKLCPRCKYQAKVRRRSQKTEHERMSKRTRRMQAGLRLAPVPEEDWIEEYGTGYGQAPRVPIAPLLPLLRDALHVKSEREIADLAHVSEKRISAILAGGQERISVVVADKVCVALGYPLSWVYQDQAA